jgi:hypothetical protein
MGGRVRAAVYLAAIASCSLLALGCGASLISIAEEAAKDDRLGSDRDGLQLSFTGDDAATGVTGNLVLPRSGPQGSTISWTSSAPGIVSPSGLVTRPPEDSEVILEATLILGGASVVKRFTITVVRALLDDAEAVAADRASLALSYSGSDSSTSVTGNLGLPASGTNGTAISWASSDASVVSPAGIVTRQASDASVTLTATISKGEASDTKLFSLTVLAMPADDASSVAADKGNLQIVFAATDDANNVTADLGLAATGSSGTAISWVSDHPKIVSAEGAVTRSPTESIDLTLTATIRKGSASDIKQFAIRVLQASIISLSPSSASFASVHGGADPAPQSVSVANLGGGILGGLGASVSYTSGSLWLEAALSATTAPATLTLQASTGSLAEGSYEATVTVSSSLEGVEPKAISVGFVVSAPPTIALSSSSLSFSATAGGANPSQQSVVISNTGGGTLVALGGSVSYGNGSGWLGATIDNSTLNVQPVTGSLAAGTYTATINVSATGATNSPKALGVTFAVEASKYALTVLSGTGGSITGPPGGAATVNPGVATNISASASGGYSFWNWTVQSGTASIVNSDSAITTVTLNSGDATIKANFYLNAAYVANWGMMVNDGLSPTSPHQSVAEGIATAQANGLGTVCIAAGTYPLSAMINVPSGILLKGGYSSDFSDWDPAQHVSALEDARTPTGHSNLIRFSSVSGSGLDGLKIVGSQSGSAQYWTEAVTIDSSTSITIRNCTIIGGEAGLDPYFSNALSIYTCTDNSVLIENNYIDGGTGTQYSCGIYVTYSHPIIRGNRIYGGTIGSSTQYTCGLAIQCDGFRNPSTPCLYNNLIYGGRGASFSHGIFVTLSYPTIYNNTICSGIGTTRASALTISASNFSTQVMNNVLFGDGAGTSYGLWEDTNDGDVGALQNNCFYGATLTHLYGNCTQHSPTYIGNNIDSIASVNSTFSTGITTTSGNLTANPDFQDIDGADNILSTLADDDWSIKTTSAIKGSGLDGSAVLTNDFGGTARSVPWSIGAYEQDN